LDYLKSNPTELHKLVKCCKGESSGNVNACSSSISIENPSLEDLFKEDESSVLATSLGKKHDPVMGTSQEIA
jgi:hypothetical protein